MSKVDPSAMMKTLIIGMGNVGTMHGWVLSQAGADVTHVVRGGRADRFEDGVKMDVLDMRGDTPSKYVTSYLPKIVEDVTLGECYELVLVATNHYQAATAVRQYRDLAPKADFLMFTANWEGTRAIDALLSRSRYLWGFSAFSGARDENDVLYANIQKSYRINELDGSRTVRFKRIIEMFGNAGLTPDIKPDIIEWLWVHHAIDAGIIGTALFARGLPEPGSGIKTWVLMVRAVRDALSVLEKRGVDVWSYADTEPFHITDEEEAANKLRQMILGMPHYERTRKHSHFATSPEEMKRFYLDVLHTGERLGVSMPYLESMKGKI